MFCPRCGSENEDGATYCASCETELRRAKDAEPSQLFAEPSNGESKPKKAGVAIALVLALAVAAIAILFGLGVIEMPSADAATDYDAVNNRVHGADNTVKDGDWIYYLFPRGTFEEDYSYAAIWRVRSDGEDNQALYEVKTRQNSDTFVGLNELYVSQGRLYFTEIHVDMEKSDSVLTLMSIALDGSDAREEMKLPSESNGVQVVGSTAYYSNNRAVFSTPLKSDESTRVASLKSEYDSWVVADGYVYVSSNQEDRTTITRTSLKDGAEESVYSDYGARPECITPFKGNLYFARQCDPDSDNYRIEIVRLDPETGDEDVLFKESRTDQYASAWAVTESGLAIVLSESDKPTTIHVASLDGSKDETAFTYSGDWAGNPLKTRNVGGAEEARLTYFCVLDNELYFWPYDSELAYSLYEDNSKKPMIASLCKLDLSENEIIPIATASSADRSQAAKPA